ncbi:hypothetical protein [Chelativorans sp. Marseille-P2723]|uniref:hypothetical protein n=1 Tax=Chelativorans sp. Marseille-P2723 TaxID=2709133 RepID=UPI0015715033|nr:hypothetical protein [Chelativorans sp. Marseille-P2723]
MSSTPRCHLTAKDFSILEDIQQRGLNNDEAFLRLLRQKLESAAIQDDIGADVATINSVVDFSVDARTNERRTLTYEGGDAGTGVTLPITTLWGLALFGLTAGKEIAIERHDGTREKIRLNAVFFQPEGGQGQMSPANLTGHYTNVISFTPREKSHTRLPLNAPFEPDDDDPGPHAA